MKKLNKKGFTLIELLAVIVILGLLMAIAIPSVTKYINQSRKKTLVSTIGNYISAVTVDVNNSDYKFHDSNTIYAVPIDCVALEKGGNDPFGEWKVQVKNDSGSYVGNANGYAYVLVQYDASTSSYTYGFTFRDSAGYGMMPTVSNEIDAKGADIKAGVAKNSFATGDYNADTNITWTGFDVKADTDTDTDGNQPTQLKILTIATSGDGKDTCSRAE